MSTVRGPVVPTGGKKNAFKILLYTAKKKIPLMENRLMFGNNIRMELEQTT
jgi:hypothetical protein